MSLSLKKEDAEQDYLKNTIRWYDDYLGTSKFEEFLETSSSFEEVTLIPNLILDLVDKILGSENVINLSNKSEVLDIIKSEYSQTVKNKKLNSFILECIYSYLEYVKIYRTNLVRDGINLFVQKKKNLESYKSHLIDQKSQLDLYLKSIGDLVIDENELSKIPILIETQNAEDKTKIISLVESIKTCIEVIKEENIIISQLKERLKLVESVNNKDENSIYIYIAFEELKEYLIKNSLI